MRAVLAAIAACALVGAACGDATGDLITRPTGACQGSACGGCTSHAECTHPELPICNVSSGRCVECISDGHCDTVGEECSTVLGECAVPCTSGDQCPPDDHICDGALGFCVECLGDDDCGPQEPFCRNSECTSVR